MALDGDLVVGVLLQPLGLTVQRLAPVIADVGLVGVEEDPVANVLPEIGNGAGRHGRGRRSRLFVVVAADAALLERCRREVDESTWSSIAQPLSLLSQFARGVDAQAMQDAWSHRSKDVLPYKLVDVAGEAAGKLIAALKQVDHSKIEAFVLSELRVGDLIDEHGRVTKGPASQKVRRLASSILAGFFVGATLNYALSRNTTNNKPLHFERAVA